MSFIIYSQHEENLRYKALDQKLSVITEQPSLFCKSIKDTHRKFGGKLIKVQGSKNWQNTLAYFALASMTKI